MATFDARKNFALTTVATAPSPATSGTSLVVASGAGTKFPAAPFNAVIWPTGANPTSTNAEIVRVTVVSTDTLTITRAQESSSARTVVVGDQIMQAVTSKTLTDIEALFPTGTVVGTTDSQTLTNKTLTAPIISTISNTGTVTLPTATDTLVGKATTDNLTNKTFDSTSPTAFFQPGFMMTHAARTVPTGWLVCDGSAVSRTTYSGLFAAIAVSVGTFTVTLATPGVFTLTAHGLYTGDQVYLTTTGALPTGLTANTLYYVVKVDANSFNLATSRANAVAGTKIATSGSQSGVHTLRDCPHGLGDGSTTFNVPDARGRVLAGFDAIGGTAASRLTLARSQGTYGNIGAAGGAESHTIITAEMASHTHTIPRIPDGGAATSFIGGSNSGANTAASTGSAGSDTAHNNVQPTLLINYIVKT